MSTINGLPSTVLYAKLKQQSAATDLAQSWQKSAESTGLRDALSITKRFLGARGGKTQDGQSESDLHQFFCKRGGHALSQEATSERASQTGGEIAGMNDSFSNSESAASTGKTQSCSPKFLPAFDFVQLVSRFASGSEDMEGSPAATPKEPKTIFHEALLARKVTILPTEDGIEVWLRDSNITKSVLLPWLAGMRHSMATLGVSLVRLSLNGKPVYWQGQQGESGSAEG